MVQANNVLVNKNYTISLGASNVDDVVNYYYKYDKLNNTPYYHFRGQLFYDNDGIMFLMADSTSGDIVFTWAGPNGVSAHSLKKWIYVAEYTKTTD